MTVTISIPTRGRVESATLTRALITAAAQGQRPHCSDPGTSELWLSDHPAERREACKLCAGCPVFEPCGAAATARQESSECGARRTTPALTATPHPRRRSHRRDQPKTTEVYD